MKTPRSIRPGRDAMKTSHGTPYKRLHPGPAPVEEDTVHGGRDRRVRHAVRSHPGAAVQACLMSDDALLRVGRHVFAGGQTVELTVGIGRAAFRHPSDPSNVVWTLVDRERGTSPGPRCRLSPAS